MKSQWSAYLFSAWLTPSRNSTQSKVSRHKKWLTICCSLWRRCEPHPSSKNAFNLSTLHKKRRLNCKMALLPRPEYCTVWSASKEFRALWQDREYEALGRYYQWKPSLCVFACVRIGLSSNIQLNHSAHWTPHAVVKECRVVVVVVVAVVVREAAADDEYCK